ncbi:uncharacterized protein LOC119578370 [Penaeus monodon]|uniref:uncharacterized protein LOC119578370 n=1 Tax=Penaeus monodon TaxID=6687 RepID=UPI0018A761C9|nr:uncharacterized protein LOC119578370 [Penaeus monodon]
MKVSRTKTEYLNTGNGTHRVGSISLGGERVQRAVEFKYLGSTVQEDGGSEAEVSKRIQAGWNSWKKVTGVLCVRRVSAKVKGGIHRTIVGSSGNANAEMVVRPDTKRESKERVYQGKVKSIKAAR